MQPFIHQPAQSLLKNAPSDKNSNNTKISEDSKTNNFTEKKKILCKECKSKITDSSFFISINNSHEHSFFNPHGYVFQIKCFSLAQGCIVTGEPSSEFTWFAGYKWQIAICALCFAHLGWKFQSGSSTFYGLIKNNIIE